jgi:hypothetical protein
VAWKELVLLLPDLGRAARTAGEGESLDGRWPTLERWLARADRSDGLRNAYEALANHLGLSLTTGRFPSAALSRLGDFGDCPAGYWLSADPVHLAADLSDAVLLPGAELGIDDAEAQALTAALNAHFRDDAIEVQWRDPRRWYLRSEQLPNIATTPLPAVAGRPVQAFLPHGPDAGLWQRILTEAQMLLHAHEVNTAREAAGRPTINGIWLWGEGALPAAPPENWQLYGEDPVLGGLCRLQGREPVGLPGVESVLAGSSMGIDRALVWLNDVSRDDLEATWFRPLDRALATGRLERLAVDPANGYVYRLTRRARRRFWCRPQGLSRHLTRE